MRPRSSGRSKEALPPFPHEVELPATFGDWYDVAAAHLGAAERRDSSWRRLAAGLLAMLLVMIGLVFASEQAVVLLGYGYDGQRVDAASLVLGLGITAGALGWWFRYRRDWVRARRLRHAWSRALRDPLVLGLPVRPAPERGPDPEVRHYFRAREHAELQTYSGVRGVDGVDGFLDFLRVVLIHPLGLAVGVVLLAAGLGADHPDGLARTLAAAVPVCLFSASALVRAVQRFGRSMVLAADERDDRRRWTGWRVLRGLDRPIEPRGPWRRRAPALAAASAGGLIAFLAAFAADPGYGLLVWGLAVGAVVGPLVVVYASFPVRALVSRSGGPGFGIEVLADDVPPLGPTAVAPGRSRLEFSEDGRVRVAGRSVSARALIRGEQRALAARAHWLVLADGSQVPFRCADVSRLGGRARAAALTVL